jgi:Holliday junction resolvase RusA-like endonuclease
MHLSIPGRIPSKKNSKRLGMAGGRPRIFSSHDYEAWHEEMMFRVKKYRPKKPLLSASVAITFFAENRRAFDLTNKAESIMDLLVDAEILADDCWSVVPQVYLRFGAVDAKNPRAEISINEI